MGQLQVVLQEHRLGSPFVLDASLGVISRVEKIGGVSRQTGYGMQSHLELAVHS